MWSTRVNAADIFMTTQVVFETSISPHHQYIRLVHVRCENYKIINIWGNKHNWIKWCKKHTSITEYLVYRVKKRVIVSKELNLSLFLLLELLSELQHSLRLRVLLTQNSNILAKFFIFFWKCFNPYVLHILGKVKSKYTPSFTNFTSNEKPKIEEKKGKNSSTYNEDKNNK